jgi:hypothetical protein
MRRLVAMRPIFEGVFSGKECVLGKHEVPGEGFLLGKEGS